MQFLESKWWPNDLEGQGKWPPFSMPTERIPRCIFGANLVILAQIHYKLSHKQVSIPAESIPGCLFPANLVVLTQICDDLSCRQAEFPKILSQNGQNDLEYQGQWPPFSIPAECIPGCIFGANLVILAQICDELSRGQAKFLRILS